MTECFRCGQEGHHRRDCPKDLPVPAAGSAGATPASEWKPPPAHTFRRDPSEICPEERVHEIAQQIRDQLFKGKPRWLALRMLAWHQVTESRRSRFSLPEPERHAAADGAASAETPSPSASSSGFSLAGAGLTPPASSPNGHAPSTEGPP